MPMWKKPQHFELRISKFKIILRVANIQGLRRLGSFLRGGRHKSMSKEGNVDDGREGEEFHELGGDGKVIQDLGMMVSILGRAGGPIPSGCMTTANIARLVEERTGHLPYEVSILNDVDALVEFEEGIPIIEVSQALHGAGYWGELDIDIGCVIATKASLMNIQREKELQQVQHDEVSIQFIGMKVEQREYQHQLADVVQHLQDKMKIIEQRSQENMVPVGGSYVKGGTSYKLSKAPDLPSFSVRNLSPGKRVLLSSGCYKLRGLRPITPKKQFGQELSIQ